VGITVIMIITRMIVVKPFTFMALIGRPLFAAMFVLAMLVLMVLMIVMVMFMRLVVVRLLGLSRIGACTLDHGALHAVAMAAAARIAVARAAAVGAVFALLLGLAVGALIGFDQRLPVGDRDLIIVRMDFAEGQEAVPVAAIFDEGGLQ
jgi:hypothetical protein